MIGPGDKVIVEGPTFLATIQCFRLYGADLVQRARSTPTACRSTSWKQLIVEHKPKFVYLIPTFGNPSGALLSLERRSKVLELAVKYQTLIVEDDPYGDLYFTEEPPPPSLLALSQGRARQPRVDRALRQHEQGAVPGPARGLADGAARAAGQGDDVQAVQRRAHQHLRAGDRGAVPEERPHAGHAGQRAQGLRASARRRWARR